MTRARILLAPSFVGRTVKPSDQPSPPGARYAQLSTRFLFLGFLLSWLPMPLSALAALPLLASFVYGVLHLRELNRAGAPSVARSAGVIGLVLTGLLGLIVLAPAAQYERTWNYQKCLWGANTIEARESCKAEFNHNPSGVENFFLN